MPKSVFEEDLFEYRRSLLRQKILGKIAKWLTFGGIKNTKNIEKATLEYEQSQKQLFRYNELSKKAEALDKLLKETEIIEGVRISKDTFTDIDINNDYGIDWNILRKDILERDNFECQESDGYCKGPLQIHHILQLSRGGTNNADNLITLCYYHHCMKHEHMMRRL